MDQKYPYEKARELITERILNHWEKTINRGFDDQVGLTFIQEKLGGYSWGSLIQIHISLMNYTDTLDSMFTLAHEFGHSRKTKI